MDTIRYVLLLALAAIPSIVDAAGWLHIRPIERVAFQTNGFFLYAEGGWNNPNGCQRSDAIILQDTDPNYDKAYSMLMAAYLAGKSVRGYSDGCVNFDGTTYNTIRGFKYLEVR